MSNDLMGFTDKAIDQGELNSDIRRWIKESLSDDCQDIEICETSYPTPDGEMLERRISSIGKASGSCFLYLDKSSFEVSTYGVSRGKAGHAIAITIVENMLIKYGGKYINEACLGVDPFVRYNRQKNEFELEITK